MLIATSGRSAGAVGRLELRHGLVEADAGKGIGPETVDDVSLGGHGRMVRAEVAPPRSADERLGTLGDVELVLGQGDHHPR